MRPWTWILAAAVAFDVAALFAACGARTGLPVPDDDAAGGGGADAGPDAPDAPPDAPKDAPPDAPPPECEDPETTTYIYLVTSEFDLYSYFPPQNAFKLIGALDCPGGGASPFSMGVDRSGIAYVVYNDGQLYRVSMADASCEETEFVPNQFGFGTFGMGFALDEAGGRDDTLYVAEISFEAPPLGLGRIDTDPESPTFFDLSFIGPFSDTFGVAMELTSSSDGNLYGFWLDPAGGGWVVQIDKTDATILEATFLPVGDGSSALAFAWWGGDFFIFTSDGGGLSQVTRYDPDDGTVTPVTTLDRTIVGAGVSTCAPGG